MAGIPFRVTGKLYTRGERSALLLWRNGEQYTIRLAYVIRGTEEMFLPESVLDDWGHEISGSELYHWVRDNSPYFPRAELFGYDLRGRPRQCFIRELDPTPGFSAYAYDGTRAPFDAGLQVHAIILTHAEAEQHQLTSAPTGITFPLRDAAVEWWLVKNPPSLGQDGDFPHILDQEKAG